MKSLSVPRHARTHPFLKSCPCGSVRIIIMIITVDHLFTVVVLLLSTTTRSTSISFDLLHERVDFIPTAVVTKTFTGVKDLESSF